LSAAEKFQFELDEEELPPLAELEPFFALFTAASNSDCESLPSWFVSALLKSSVGLALELVLAPEAEDLLLLVSLAYADAVPNAMRETARSQGLYFVM